MLGREFRSLAEAVTRTYGDDPWFFLRELAQNSRDAGAKAIWVTAERNSAGHECLTFVDDGTGMSLPHARRFLFRLYASDKGGNRMSAGKYGIGFWTILGFLPSQISLQSRRKKESWAMLLNADLEAQPAPCTLTRSGTSVYLTRPAAFPTASTFSQAVENALRNYCRFLRRNDRSGTPLPVFFHGQNLTVALRLPGPLTYSFHNGAVEGAVGLGEKPMVRLYARGLPVWEGAVLGQMSHLQTHDPAQSEIGQGLFPVFLLNGNRLDVTFSRRLALENKALEKVRKTAEKALQRLLSNALESAFPRPWVQRGGDHLRTMAGRLRRPGWLWLALLLLVVLPLEIVLLERFFPPRGRPAAGFFDLSTASIQYSGASVGSAVSELSARFSYTPADPRWFKVFSAADYDLQAGFVRRRGEFFSAAVRGGDCAKEQTVTMRFHTAVAGRVMLPLPPGYAIEPDSVAYGPESRPLLLSGNSLGEWSAEIPFAPGTIVYRSCPESGDTTLTAPEAKRLTRLPPGLALPALLEKSLSAARALTTADKTAHAQALVRAAVRYDASESTARLYRRFARGRQWLPRVLAIGKGDCDVINGVHVLLLRRLGIPARLAVGLIGSEGRIRSGLHAWSEYFDGGWRIVDASASESGPASPAPAASERSARSGSDDPVVPAPLPEPGTRPSAVFIALALALPLILLVLLWRKTGRRRKMTAPRGREKELILPVIQQALLRPEIWGQQSPLWSHRFLPTSCGRPISIRRAFALLRRGRLLYFTSPNPLIAARRRRGVPILDLSQKIFAPLLNIIPGAVNLDLIFRLQPQPPPERRGADGDLLAAVNSLLAKYLKKPPLCLLSPGLGEADFFHVFLPFTPNRKDVFFPRRFIAVNPSGNLLAELTALFKVNRSLAVLRFLQALNSRSLLPLADRQAFFRKAARRLLCQNP